MDLSIAINFTKANSSVQQYYVNILVSTWPEVVEILH